MRLGIGWVGGCFVCVDRAQKPVQLVRVNEVTLVVCAECESELDVKTR
jgi:hypothetical protein